MRKLSEFRVLIRGSGEVASGIAHRLCKDSAEILWSAK